MRRGAASRCTRSLRCVARGSAVRTGVSGRNAGRCPPTARCAALATPRPGLRQKKKTERVRHKLSANRVVRPELPDLRCCSSRSWTSDLHTQFGVKSSSLDFA
jgi:hypothetical protein